MAQGGRASFYYLGIVILPAMLVGGGTEQSLWTDHLIEALLIPAILMGFAGVGDSRLGWPERILALLIVALCVAQFAPLQRAWPPADAFAVGRFFNPAPGRGLEAALFLLAMLGLALQIARLDDPQQERLVRFFFMGLAINFAIGAVQLSFAREEGIAGILPYTVNAGVFANENHLSAFVVAMIPLLAWRYLGVSRRFGTFLGIAAAALVFVFAVGSRAGMAMAVAMSVLIIVWFATAATHPYLKAAAVAVALTALFSGIFAVFGSQILEGDLRLAFFRNTLAAVTDFLPFGSGLGTFRLVYPLYEKQQDIFQSFANQAHNDYLQIVLEAGYAGAALILAYFVLAFRGAAGSKLAQAAFVGVVAFALHSTVDYPLRTAANGVLFAYLTGVLLSRRRQTPPPDRA